MDQQKIFANQPKLCQFAPDFSTNSLQYLLQNNFDPTPHHPIKELMIKTNDIKLTQNCEIQTV